jgi:hypothetical protein
MSKTPLKTGDAKDERSRESWRKQQQQGSRTQELSQPGVELVQIKGLQMTD